MRNFLLVGFSPVIIKSLEDLNDLNLYVIEEEELYLANEFDKHEINSSPILKEVFFTKYMNSNEYEKVVEELDEKIHFDGIMPVRDYAVRAASKMADKLSLNGIGGETSEILTNKLLLREACEKYSIPHPRYAKITSINDLKEFYRGEPIIFKPANRQASLGISKINSNEDIENAWNYTINAEESNKQIIKRDFSDEYIAEEFVDGYEVSVETIVQNGKIIFNNITSKISLEDSFVEVGHIVPANIDIDIKKKIEKEKLDFVEKLNIKNGLLHSEWKVSNGSPILIECAGRTPGDGISTLISNTYEFNFFSQVCRVYLGEMINIKNVPKKVSTVRFFIGQPGVIKDILGVDILGNNKNIIKSTINVKRGNIVTGTKSSWDRLGLFFTYADSYEQVENDVNEIMNTVKFIIE